MARWENVPTNLHHQDLLWRVKGLQLKHGHLLNQAEVVDELPLPLGQLIDHLFQGGKEKATAQQAEDVDATQSAHDHDRRSSQLIVQLRKLSQCQLTSSFYFSFF